jgi:predicted transcriptional regulator
MKLIIFFPNPIVAAIVETGFKIRRRSPYSFYPFDSCSRVMTIRRSKTEIYIDVLSVIKNGESRPTRIMYSTNLSWAPLRRLLESLLEQNLIEAAEVGQDDGRSKNLYKITEKGESVLTYFSKCKDILSVETAANI